MESLQMAFGCSQLVCRGADCWLWRACASRNGASLNLSAFAWAPLQRDFLWWGLPRQVGWCHDLPGTGPVVQPGPEKSPGAVPIWPDGAFAILTCLLQDSSQNLVLILMQIGTVSVRNRSLPYPRSGPVPSLCWLHVLLHPAAVLPAQPLLTLSLQLH